MTIKKQPGCSDPFEKDAIKVDDARRDILKRINVLSDFQKVPIRDSLNRVLFEAIHSPINVPAHDNSAMDGYALNSRDLPGEEIRSFPVIGTAYAGKPFHGQCGAGECVRVMTGAVMPEGTDSIVAQEHVNVLANDRIEIGGGHRQGQNVRCAGEDVKQGALVFASGAKIRPADLGVMASLGINEVKVFRKPRVSFFSTGDELRSLGEVLQPGEIYDSNRYSLYGVLANCHVDIIDLGVVRDDPESIRQALLSAAACSDMVLTSGGVSVGDADYIKRVLKEVGDMDFWKIAMKPGRPLTFGKIKDCLFFGLPGNPVAVMVTFFQFVLPALTRLSGAEVKQTPTFVARCQDKIRKQPGRMEFQRAITHVDEQGQLLVSLTGKQGSGILTSMSLANCFIVLPEDRGSVEVGEDVGIQFLNSYCD